MKKIVATLSIAAALTMSAGIANAEKDAVADKATEKNTGWTIGGIAVPNPLADKNVSNPFAGVKLPEALSGIKIPDALANVRFGNPLDPSTWWDGADHSKYTPGESMTFNFASPEFWMSIPNPKTHSGMHGAMTNPANWAQFLKIESYANMLDTKTWEKWLDTKSYDVLLDPQTYAYWMQPGAYQHLVNINHYAQMLEPSAYATLLDAALSNAGLTFKAPADVLDVSEWLNSVTKMTETKT